jgi:hypothetical protein
VSTTLDELVASVEFFLPNLPPACSVKDCPSCPVKRQHVANARELVRRLREGVAKCDEMELTPGFDQVSTSRRGAARQIRAALTGATEESKSDG